jgi:hypothetical protein
MGLAGERRAEDAIHTSGQTRPWSTRSRASRTLDRALCMEVGH